MKKKVGEEGKVKEAKRGGEVRRGDEMWNKRGV